MMVDETAADSAALPDAMTGPPSAAVLTPGGRGAVATIRFAGDCRTIDAAGVFHAANGRPLAAQTLGRICFGHWGRGSVEEVVVCRRDRTRLEIHCHGGDAAVRRILADLQGAGCTIQSASDQETALGGVFAAECIAALSRAATLRTADLLLEQTSGTLAASFAALQQIAPSDRSELCRRLDRLLGWSRFGLHLCESWRVVLTGRPNVGKSSLINALLGYRRSIVFDEPGTTRDVLTAETAIDGWPVQLVDTAGLRATDEDLESAGIARARRQLEQADCRVILLDTGQPPVDEDFALLSEWTDPLIVAHKSDLPDRWGRHLPAGALRVSSITGAGVQELCDALIARLIPDLPPPGTPIPFTERQVTLLTHARSAALADDGSTCTASLLALLP